MNNLYVLHTQYNIILGGALALGKFKDDCNDLIVYAEFAVSDEYKNRLAQVFNNVFYIRELFEPLPQSDLKTEYILWKEYRKYKSCLFAKKRYDHVFMSQERPLDCLILGNCKRINPACICSDIEENCYYSVTKEHNDLAYKKPQGRNIIHRLRQLFYGSDYLYQTDCFFYGQSSLYNDWYVLYPNCLRSQLVARNVKAHQIRPNEITTAVNAIYGEKRIDIPRSEKYYLFFFDLLERYENPDGIDKIVKKLQQKATAEGAVLLLKYHPREVRKFDLAGNVIEILAKCPAEKVICDLYGKNVVVFGNATTAIIIANLSGFKTYCIAKINGSDNEVMLNKFIEMGISVPSSIDDIQL